MEKMDSTLPPKSTKKSSALWVISFIIGVSCLFTGLRVQWVNAANAPVNLLDGVHEVRFSYNSYHLTPQDLEEDASTKGKKVTATVRPSTYIAGSKSDTIKEEFPSADFLFDMDSEVYRAVQGGMQERGWHAVGSGASQAILAKGGRTAIKPFNDSDERKVSSSDAPNLPDLLLKIIVLRRFESGKCLFCVYASMAKAVIYPADAQDDPKPYNTFLTNKPELIVVDKKDAKSAVEEEVTKTVSLLLGKSATHFTGVAEVANE